MADDDADKRQSKANDSAEKAYAAAAEAVPAKPVTKDAAVAKETVTTKDTSVVDSGSAPSGAVKASAAKPAGTETKAKPKLKAQPRRRGPKSRQGEAKAPANPQPAKAAKAKSSAPPKPKTAEQPLAATSQGKAKTGQPAEATSSAPAKPAISPDPAPASPQSSSVREPRTPEIQRKEKTMANIPTDLTNGVQGMVTEAQAKSREAIEKGTQFFGDIGEFTKGNIEAVIETNQILAGGLKDFASQILEETRTVVEGTTQDMKDLAGAKTPADFMKVQSEVARKNMDAAVAYTSRNSEAMFKLVSDVMAPMSGRVSVAMQKVRTASV